MTEFEFLESIDCKFPYGSEADCRPLVELGTSLSPNAAFMVLHEICRIPANVAASRAEVDAMLECWRQHFKHPLVEQVLPAARDLLDGKPMAVEAALGAMEVVAGYPGQYNALAILYFACDDIEGKAEALQSRIIKEWTRT